MSGLETERQIAGTPSRAANARTGGQRARLNAVRLERAALRLSGQRLPQRAAKAVRLEAETETVRIEQALHDARAVLETVRQQHRAALGVIDDDLKRRQIETANGEDQTLALVKSLPAVAGSLKIHELNVGEDLARTLGRGLARLSGKEATP